MQVLIIFAGLNSEVFVVELLVMIRIGSDIAVFVLGWENLVVREIDRAIFWLMPVDDGLLASALLAGLRMFGGAMVP